MDAATAEPDTIGPATLRVSASEQMHARSLRGLDWLNFLIADVQTGFGPFIAVYLTSQHWTQIDIGLALTIGTVTAAVSQLPGGALVDWLRSKRTAAVLAILAIAGSALLFAVRPDRLQVYTAEVLHGFASCVLTPSVAAISLALVGRAALGNRLGRNARFAAIGNGAAAGVLGVIGSFVSSRSVFVLTAALAVPALLALRMMGPVRVPRMRRERRDGARGLRRLLRDRRLLVFATAAFLFHFSNAAMLPIAAGRATAEAGNLANLVIAACIVVPQIVVAGLSPWVGRTADLRGRRTVLLIGWAALPARGLLMALLPSAYALIALQALSGISAAVFGIMLPLVCADVTRGTGRFNLIMGAIGLAVFAGASLSTTVAGWLADAYGTGAAFLGLSAAGAAGVVVIWALMPETRPRTRHHPLPPA